MAGSKFSAITFDAAGTLFTVATPVGQTYAEVALRYGARLSPDVLVDGFREAFAAMPPLAFPGAGGDVLDDLEREWWHTLVYRVVSAAGGVEAFEDYFDELYEFYACGHAWRTYPEVEDVLVRLRQVGFRTAIVSNFDSRLESILAALELDRLVGAVVFSSAAGAAKPDRAIFEQALSILHAKPGETLHVGDSWHADYEGARDAGLSALLLRRAGAPGPTREAVAIGELSAIATHL